MSVEKIQQYNNQIENIIKSNQVNDQLRQLITENKIQVLQLNSLSQFPKNANPNEILAARKFSELNVEYSLLIKDVDEFESAMSRLKVFYDHYRGIIQPSDQMNQLIALNLLYLFSYNKTIQFHQTVELIPIEDLNDQYIKYVMDLENKVNIGSYQEILNQKGKSPLQKFNFFLDRIIDTIRYEKARSAEKAYKSLAVNDAIKIFNLDSIQQLQIYVNSNSEKGLENGYQWVIEGNRLHFKSTDKQHSSFNSQSLIRTTLNYAQELEKII